MQLSNVPKLLKEIKEAAGSATVISFKLETDPHIISEKIKQSFTKYSIDMIIGNLLNTRKQEVSISTYSKVNEEVTT